VNKGTTEGDLDTLLKNLGFIKGNPFISLEAGKEEGKEWFYASFVEPPRFAEILGDAASPQPALVFAPRGSGKTALRVMLDYYCHRGYIPGGKVLSILHTDLSRLEEIARLNPQIPLSRFHAEMILRSGLAALCRQAKAEPTLQDTLQKELKADERAYLRWYISLYGQNLSLSQMRFLRQLGLYPESQEGLGFLAKREEEPTHLFSDLLGDKPGSSYVLLLQQFVELLLNPKLFVACYVLVDGVDELESTATDWAYAIALVEPLAANLKLLDLAGVGFKFFLPAEMKPYLEAREAVRRDRVLWYDLVWTKERLLELLHKRLLAFSDYHIESLDQISVDALKGGRLEREMVEACAASPRTLLRLGQDLLRQQAALVSEEEKDWRIREIAWKRAREVVLSDVKGGLTTVAVEPPPATVEDVREQLFHLILQNYPAPIALTCRDYLIQPEPPHKLRRLLDLFEVTLGFCGVLMIAQYCQQVESAQGRQPKSLAQVVGGGCSRTTLGTWQWILIRLTGVSGSLGKTSIGRQLHRFLGGKSGKAIERLIELRNQMAHSAQRADEAYYRQQLAEAESWLFAIMEGLTFLADVNLIQVNNLRKQEQQYLHQARLYRGDNPTFPWIDIELPFSLECGKLLIIHHDSVLTAHPLLVVERCPECGQEELFLYQRIEGDELFYHSFFTGHNLPTAKHRADIAALLGI
jgi:hypothetical protein